MANYTFNPNKEDEPVKQVLVTKPPAPKKKKQAAEPVVTLDSKATDGAVKVTKKTSKKKSGSKKA